MMLMGQGCFTPAPGPRVPAEQVPAAPTQETTSTAPTPTPTPAPKPAPKPRPSGTTVKPKTVTVEIKDNAFSPQIIAINAGDTVVWKNVGTGNHTTRGLRNGPLVWDSGTLAPGQTYSRTFSGAGRFGYSCSIHASMSGEVIVGEVQPSP
jgi:plastocyanin